MSLNQEIILLRQKYQQLPRVDSPPQKQAIIDEIRVIGKRVEALATAENNSFKLRHLKGVLAVVNQVEARLNRPPSAISSDSHQAVVDMAVDMLAQKSREMKALQGSCETMAEVRQRIVAAVGVLSDVEEIVREEGDDLIRLEQNIDAALGNVEVAGEEVQDLVERQRRSRLRRLRASMVGLFTGLGYYLLGLPGMAVGLVSGWLF